ncbi:MAG: hypoxanthine phosphoribosyltransferase [Elusimicrobia bacterium]|nr:MAG: hypoxanthine phosphoribosyltransferase [Elusimicrobiota bacterium]
MHPDIERVLISEEDIQAKIAEIAAKIDRDYENRTPVLIGILKGSVLFLSDLLKRVTIDCSIDFMCVSSYEGDKSTGVVRLILDLRESIEGKDILLVEDIIDTGLTLGYLRQNLMTRKPRSLEIVSLLDKPDTRKVTIEAKYPGFQIPNEFVVGFGLDYNERYRNLPYIGVLKPAAYAGEGA